MTPADADVHVTDDVPSAFAELAADAAPATFVLCGGSTGAACYRAVAALGADWRRTTFLLGDERWVPVGHADSNEGQARRLWLDGAATGPVHSLRGAGTTPEAAAGAYDRLIDGLASLDLVHLGLGDDAHIASLFPGSPALDVTDRFAVATGDDAHDWPRVTLTFPALGRARHVVVTATGATKHEAFGRARAGDPRAPAARLVAPRITWIVDPAVRTGSS